jgi:hypothetical protein
MAEARKTPPLPAPRGAAWVGLLMLATAAGLGYLGWVWGPVYIENYEAKQLVREFGNEAVRDPDDARLVERFVTRLRALGNVQVVDEQGRTVQRPAIDLQVRDVTWERIPPDSLRVAFEYQRPVAYPFLDRTTEQVFAVDMTLDVSRANWGK